MTPRFLPALLLACLCAAPAMGETSAETPSDPHAADRAALRELAHTYEKAVAAGNLAALEPHLAPDFTAVMTTGDEIQGVEGLRAHAEKIQKLLAGGSLATKVFPEPAQFEGDLALCRGRTEEMATTQDGKTFPFASRFTIIARKTGDGKFQIVRLQAGINPVENSFVAAAVKSASALGAFAGAVGGLLLGLGLGWWLGKRRRA